MKLKVRSPWFWLPALLVALVLGIMLYLQQSMVNTMHPALDRLSKLPLSQRWSDPDMLKIRALGEKAVPELRRVLREKGSATTRFLLWLKPNWPRVKKISSHWPDPAKLTERRATACQVIESLGPAARSAAPDLIAIYQGNDLRDFNMAFSALNAIGIDSKICDRLDGLMEAGVTNWAHSQLLMMLSSVKPPSARTLKVVATALSDPSPHVQHYAARTLGDFGVASPEIIAALKHLQASTSDPLTLVSALSATWKLEKDSGHVVSTLFPVFENGIANFKPSLMSGSGGQGVEAGDQVFMEASDVLTKMKLDDRDKAEALRLFEAYCEKSGRIFVRMLLLPGMIQLGYPADKCRDVCRDGLDAPEDYYRKQAAQLLFEVAETYPVDEFDLERLLHDKDVGVRVYIAKVHWLKHHDAKAVVPVLVESLDRSSHQSYYYPQILNAALHLLGEIGPDAREAAEPLKNIQQDPDPAVAKLAAETLSKIQK